MEATNNNSTSSTYRGPVTLDGYASAHQGDRHHEGTIITVQQYFFVFGNHPSSCARVPTPSNPSPTHSLYSSPRPERTALRPSIRAPMGTTSHTHRRRSPVAPHSEYALPAPDMTRRQQQHPPSRPQPRHRRRRPLPRQRVDDRGAGNAHSTEPG